MANELGIDNVHFTNRNMKYSKIINLKIDKHYEDDEYEISVINDVCNHMKYKCDIINVNDVDG